MLTAPQGTSSAAPDSLDQMLVAAVLLAVPGRTVRGTDDVIRHTSAARQPIMKTLDADANGYMCLMCSTVNLNHHTCASLALMPLLMASAWASIVAWSMAAAARLAMADITVSPFGTSRKETCSDG